MTPFLQIVLSLSILVVTVYLILLLVQARRTAAAMERLAESATRDLHQVTEDIHEIRLRLEHVTDMAQKALELPSALSQVVAGVVRGLPGFFGRRAGGSNFVEMLLTGIQTALHLFRKRKAEPAKESPHE